jgi:hypothetical protein
MGFFRRRRKPDAGSGPAEGLEAGATAETPANGARTVRERIEVTVEREWFAIVVRSLQAGPAIDGSVTSNAVAAEAEARSQSMLDQPDAELREGD